MSKASTRGLGLDARTGEPLFWLLGAGHEVRSRDYFWDASTRHDRSQLTIQLTITGAGYYESSSGRSIIAPGQAWMDVIPGPYTYGFHSGSPAYELVFISIAGSEVMRWHERLAAEFGHVLDFGPRSPVEAQLLSIAHMLETGKLPDRYLLSGMLYQLLMMVYSTLRGSRVSTNPRISRAIELIHQQASDHRFNVDALAALLDCSREYLSRQFHTVTGVSPSEYLTQHRLRTAARLMRETDDKLDHIARKSGFSGANYLCRTFKSRLGVTPTQIRAQPWLVV